MVHLHKAADCHKKVSNLNRCK